MNEIDHFRKSQIKKNKHIICYHCHFHSGQCFCDQLISIPTKIRFTIVMHHREYHLTSNTGRLAKNTLRNCQIILRGIENTSIDWNKIIKPKERTFVLFPSEDATEINQEGLVNNLDDPLHIIVPDGSWRQASKVYKREHALRKIKCIKLAKKNYQSNYFLRKSPRENYLCTYEAMSKVIEELESSKFARTMDSNLKQLVNVSFKNRKHCLPQYSKEGV